MGRQARAATISPRTLASLAIIEVVVIVFGLLGCQYTRAIPQVEAAATFPQVVRAAGPDVALPWPNQGQATLAIDGIGKVGGSRSSGTPVPIASTAKVMTALVTLEKHPLQGGAPGPVVTISAGDVQRYEAAILQDQSVLEVRAGETITERELLEGLLIPSANNYAEILAAWNSGSVSAFVGEMNARAVALGMRETRFDDPSGFSAKTVSTANDLLLLAQAAMANPVFADIVARQEATLPVVGVVESTNELLKEPGVIGIKTGETDAAGGCLLFAANVKAGGESRRVIGVVLGEKDRATAFVRAKALLDALPGLFSAVSVVRRGDAVGVFAAPWGGEVAAIAGEDLTVTAFAGEAVTAAVKLDTVTAPVAAGTKVGELMVSAGSRQLAIPVVAAADIPEPGPGWRLLRN